MPDEATQADASTEGSEGVIQPEDSGAQAASGAGSGSGTGTDVVDRETHRKVQNEAKSLRERLKAAEGRVAEFESLGKSEAEKMQGELAKQQETVEKLTAANRSLMVAAIAPTVDIVDPLAAAKLVDWSTIEDVTDADSVKRALGEVAKNHPALVRPSSGGADGGAGSRRGRPTKLGDMNTMIRRAAGRSVA